MFKDFERRSVGYFGILGDFNPIRFPSPKEKNFGPYTLVIYSISLDKETKLTVFAHLRARKARVAGLRSWLWFNEQRVSVRVESCFFLIFL